jgi:hypothetical protein
MYVYFEGWGLIYTCMKHLKHSNIRIKPFNKLNEDNSDREYVYQDGVTNLQLGDLVEVQETSGRYGQTKTYQGVITELPDSLGSFTLDDEYRVIGAFDYDFETGKRVGYSKNTSYDHGHETYVKKITEEERDHKLDVPKAYRPTYTVRLKEPNDGSGTDQGDLVAEISSRRGDEFKEWLKENYPTAKNMKEMDKSIYKTKWYQEHSYLNVHVSAPHSSGFLYTYLIL